MRKVPSGYFVYGDSRRSQISFVNDTSLNQRTSEAAICHRVTRPDSSSMSSSGRRSPSEASVPFIVLYTWATMWETGLLGKLGSNVFSSIHFPPFRVRAPFFRKECTVKYSTIRWPKPCRAMPCPTHPGRL